MPGDDAQLVRTALARFRALPPGLELADLEQEAWVALLEAARSYDPAQHTCTREAYLVRCTTHHLSRLCARARTAPFGRLDIDVVDDSLGPAEEAIIREQVRRPRRKR